MPHLVRETPHEDRKPGHNLLLDCYEEKFAQVRNALVKMHNLLLGLRKLLFLLLFELCNVGVSPLHENGTNASRDRFSPAAPSSCA